LRGCRLGEEERETRVDCAPECGELDSDGSRARCDARASQVGDSLLERCHLTNRWSARVEAKVSSPNRRRRGAQLNR